MRFIEKKPTPEAQRALQKYIAEHRDKANWKDFPNPDKQSVRLSIAREQGFICAYCMRRIDEYAQIEHWEAQELSKEKDNIASTVKYENLLAVCSGGKIHGKSNDSNRFHCDSSRSIGNRQLSVKPTALHTLSSIKFLENGRIEAICTCQNNPCSIQLKCIHCDLDCQKGLNLNLLSLQDERKQALSNIRRALQLCRNKNGADVKKFHADRKKILLNAIGNSEQLKPYCGVIEFFYKQYL